MKTSEKTDQIVPAYISAQAAVTPAEKNGFNTHFKTKYVDLDSAFNACRDALRENKIGVFQTINEQGDRMITRLFHESCQWLEGSTPLLMGGKQDMQAIGSATTYARRIGLMAAMGITPEDDDGHAASAEGYRAKPMSAHEAKEVIKWDVIQKSIDEAEDEKKLKKVEDRVKANKGYWPQSYISSAEERITARRDELEKAKFSSMNVEQIIEAMKTAEALSDLEELKSAFEKRPTDVAIMGAGMDAFSKRENELLDQRAAQDA